VKGILILDYDPGWPIEFDRIREKFQLLLGNLVLEIVHIGAASIPVKRLLASEADDNWDCCTGGKGAFVAYIVRRARERVSL